MQKELNLKKHYHQEGRSGHLNRSAFIWPDLREEKRPRRKWCCLQSGPYSAMGQRNHEPMHPGIETEIQGVLVRRLEV
jgi:hypothetical protein